MNHHQSRNGAVGKRLLNPVFTVPYLSGFEQYTDLTTLTLERPSLRLTPGHSDLAHHGVKKIRPFGASVQNPIPCLEEPFL